MHATLQQGPGNPHHGHAARTIIICTWFCIEETSGVSIHVRANHYAGFFGAANFHYHGILQCAGSNCVCGDIIAIILLCDFHAIPVGEVSAKGAGKHTTTATRLYHLPGGGQLIDSPGVREFNLWQISQQEVQKGFRELQPFLNHCKFRDCHHLVEPGCEVLAAVESGKISKKRYESYQKLMKEAAAIENRLIGQAFAASSESDRLSFLQTIKGNFYALSESA